MYQPWYKATDTTHTNSLIVPASLTLGYPLDPWLSSASCSEENLWGYRTTCKFCYNTIIQVYCEPGYAAAPTVSSSISLVRELLKTSGTSLWCLSCHPTISVNTWNETQSTDLSGLASSLLHLPSSSLIQPCLCWKGTLNSNQPSIYHHNPEWRGVAPFMPAVPTTVPEGHSSTESA